MNKPLDLPDVTVHHDAVHKDCFVVTHKKTRMTVQVPADRLNAWLLRQLRQELVSTKESK